jgi:hypothetical protein
LIRTLSLHDALPIYVIKTDPIDYWVENNLEQDGIEMKIEKLIGLLAIVAKGHLISNPEDVNSIAYILQCNGKNHKIIE